GAPVPPAEAAPAVLPGTAEQPLIVQDDEDDYDPAYDPDAETELLDSPSAPNRPKENP
ncbi:MAG: hypothetical protein HOV79_32915, partial [Hamadaea sp.]|nr:hypothetical protein [Hamadaea sp.]